jgi:hypothetical protein
MGAMPDRVTTDLVAFAATLREGLVQLDFAGRERLVRLLIERVVVTDDQVTIEHVIPLSGRFARLRTGDRGSGGDPPDPHAPWPLHGGRGSGAGRARIAVTGRARRQRGSSHARPHRPASPMRDWLLGWSLSSARVAPAVVAARGVMTLRLGHYAPRAVRGVGQRRTSDFVSLR